MNRRAKITLPTGLASAVSEARDLLEVIQKRLERIEAIERSRCLQDLCAYCREPYPVRVNPADGKYWHYSHPHFRHVCAADPIRRRAAERGQHIIEMPDLPNEEIYSDYWRKCRKEGHR